MKNYSFVWLFVLTVMFTILTDFNGYIDLFACLITFYMMFKNWSDWVDRRNCDYGHHWYGGDTGVYTCGTYHKTGPLEGESHCYNGLGQGGYRKERHCLACDRSEMWHKDKNIWIDITHITSLRPATKESR